MNYFFRRKLFFVMIMVMCNTIFVVASQQQAQPAQPFYQAWYNTAAQKLSSAVSKTSQNIAQNKSFQQIHKNPTVAASADFARQNPWLVGSILTAIGLGSYWAFKRMMYKSRLAQIKPHVVLNLYPGQALPRNAGLCPGVYNDIAGKLSDISLGMAINYNELYNRCSSCGQAHNLRITKPNRTSPITLSVYTGDQKNIPSLDIDSIKQWAQDKSFYPTSSFSRIEEVDKDIQAEEALMKIEEA